jgi:hypothetical protein
LTVALAGVSERFPLAPGCLDRLCRRPQKHRHWNDRLIGWEEKVAAAIAARPDVALLGQSGQRADGNADMALRANAIAHDSHALFALRHQPVVMRQDLAGNAFAECFDGSFPVPLRRTGLKLECLKREQIFHGTLHRPAA